MTWLRELVAVSRRVAATSARSEKTAVLASFLRRLEPDEIEIAVHFLTGRPRQGRLAVGGALLSAAERGAVRSADRPRSHPDLFDPGGGAPAERASAQPPGSNALTVSDVDEIFERVASRAGAGSAGDRTRELAELFGRATPEEADFLIRLIAGELRQGALRGIMEEALAQATGIPIGELRRAVMLEGDLGGVARAVLVEGRSGLERFRLVLFRPLLPMLAQTAEDVEQAMTRLGEAFLEFKLDGARVQVHKSGEEVRVFSRELNDVTAAVPDLVEAVRGLPAREAILDGEVLALRPDLTPHPFQVTMRRFGRRLNVDPLRRELPLTPYFFDLLSLDGEPLYDAPARRRFAALGDVASSLVVPRQLTSDPVRAAEFLDESLRRGHEGLMAKAPEAAYEAGGRGQSWLKVKPAHTLDLVVVAAEWGHGRRTGWLSNIHLGARDPAGGFAMVGKTFKGMTDEMLQWQTKRFLELAIETETQVVRLRPELVVEVAFDDVQESPHYPSRVALRFARVKRYREDKSAHEADTIDLVRAIRDGQKRKSR